MIERGPVTAAQLGGTLRKSVVAAQRLGAVHAWLPASETPLMTPSTRVSEVLATTCAEAEAHAALLVQSSLEHADAVAVFISRRSPFLPHSVGRTANEHALRAMHFLDPTVDERERAARRMNEWLYAIKETRRRRVGIVNAGHPGAELMPDEAPMRERIFARAETLGLLVNRTQDGGYVGALRRVSTMKLAEQYLSAPGGGGVSSAALRLHAGMTHGVETALLSTSEHGERGGRRLATPKSMEPSVLAFHLMGVLVATVNAIRSLAVRYHWDLEGRAADVLATHQAGAMDTWQRAIREYLDVVAPDRERSGVFAERPAGVWPTSS